MRNSILALAAIAGVAASPAFAGAVNLVQNGDFTDLTNGVGQITGNPTTAVGWTTTGYNLVMTNGTTGSTNSGGGFVKLWTDENGGNNDWNGAARVGNFVAMDGDFNTYKVSQTVNGLTAGDNYTVSFDYAFAQQAGFTGDTIQSLGVSLGGASQQTADYGLASKGFSGWMNGAMTFTATSSSEDLSFLAKGNLPVPPFALVSDVKLMAAAPEPATWAMMGLGFAGLGVAGLRSRRRTLAALA